MRFTEGELSGLFGCSRALLANLFRRGVGERLGLKNNQGRHDKYSVDDAYLFSMFLEFIGLGVRPNILVNSDSWWLAAREATKYIDGFIVGTQDNTKKEMCFWFVRNINDFGDTPYVVIDVGDAWHYLLLE